jgi:hypothetical protein
VGIAALVLALAITVTVIAVRSATHPLRSSSEAVARSATVAVPKGGVLLDATASFYPDDHQNGVAVPIWYVKRVWCVVGASSPMHGYTLIDYATLDAHSGGLLRLGQSLQLVGGCTTARASSPHRPAGE